MNTTLNISSNKLLPVFIETAKLNVLLTGESGPICDVIDLLKSYSFKTITVITTELSEELSALVSNSDYIVFEKNFFPEDLDGKHFVIACGNNELFNESVEKEASEKNILVYVNGNISSGNLHFGSVVKNENASIAIAANGKTAVLTSQVKSLLQNSSDSNEENNWKKLTTRLIIIFALMVIGHIVISYLPLPSFHEIVIGVKPYFDRNFLFFVLAGFLAQMVDGVLSMGYGVTSATCLMGFGVSPVAVSAAIHTSEVFTTGISGYSHYRFGNVNKKMFKHLVIPGVIGAILGALMLVYLGENSGKWLTPLIALYAGFLGVKILIKAFSSQVKRPQKIKRIGWLAGVGGFLDSFGGGGWGPIVTSSIISKGRSPRYTVGSVSLTEFFVTIASAATFFITVGISHWNIVLGLLIGGGTAAPIAARLAGKLPKKAMMIAVGIMVMIWCIRMLFKSLA
ncbi:MAG: transporter permease [Chitinophagaceae bacterium]|nr:transporter permease [Chitinophagaceae bacterium]